MGNKGFFLPPLSFFGAGLYRIIICTIMMELSEWISELRKCGKLIVVEGKKDKRALESLGVSEVYILKKPLFAAAEEIAGMSKDVVILTDLDRTGKRIYAKLNSDLQSLGVRIDNRLREELFKTKVRQIEGIGHALSVEQGQ